MVAAPALIPHGQQLDIADFARYVQLQNSSRADSWLKWLLAKEQTHEGRLQGPRFANTGMLINAAVNGLGLAIVPIVLIERELRDGALHLPFVDPVPSGESYFAVYPQRKAHLKTVLAFRDWLISETQALRQR